MVLIKTKTAAALCRVASCASQPTGAWHWPAITIFSDDWIDCDDAILVTTIKTLVHSVLQKFWKLTVFFHILWSPSVPHWNEATPCQDWRLLPEGSQCRLVESLYAASAHAFQHLIHLQPTQSENSENMHFIFSKFHVCGLHTCGKTHRHGTHI